MIGGQINALDPNSLSDLKRLARDGNSQEALRAAAKQFEGLFLQLVLKSMRDATPQNGLFDSDQTRMLQSMQDQQLAANLANGPGVGLADAIFRQMGGDTNLVSGSAAKAIPESSGFDLSTVQRFASLPVVKRLQQQAEQVKEQAEAGQSLAGQAVTLAVDAANKVVREARDVADGARGFVRAVWDHAVEASRETGIPAEFMVAQAALETGWGRAVLKNSDGSSSHNLFNIKAGRSWKGDVVALPVTEYANGRAYTEPSRFRSYESYAESFRDYARLLSENDRYAGVLGEQDAAAFARGLQDAGYATDPHYADKLTRIIRGNTLKVALSGS